MKIEVSNGEIADKYTILKIKLSKSAPMSQKYFNIHEEYLTIKSALEMLNIEQQDVEELYEINKKLWYIEDAIRQCESKKNFGEEFIKLARSVYETNDKRFEVKNKINSSSNSLIKEEKILPKY